MVAESKTNNVRTLMTQHEVTVDQLAEQLGISVSTINRLLIGSKIDPRLSTLRPLAQFFNVSIDELLGDRPLNARPGDNNSLHNSKRTLVQVPALHWEQVKNAAKVVPTLDFHKWNRWVVAPDTVSPLSYALQIQHSSLPPPFYWGTEIIVDPEYPAQDGDYIVAMQEHNAFVCQLLLHGTHCMYRVLNRQDHIIEGSKIKVCGTIVQWTTYNTSRRPL